MTTRSPSLVRFTNNTIDNRLRLANNFALWLLDSNRSLEHRSGLISFLRNYPHIYNLTKLLVAGYLKLAARRNNSLN